MQDFAVGDTIGGYEITRKEPLENVHGTYYELIHSKTGARHIHVACPDDNSAFAVMFPTVPKDSTGVAHILEHVALAGSRRYPVRDPFSSMGTRSLRTFMNAFTGSDATFYPFSTRNKKDYFNLLSVYLDATFFPKIEETAFRQEGHRLEFDKLEDPSSGLRFKGVVFNEMKGLMATPPVVLFKSIGKALYPDLTYACNSGGDPAVIPDLTWDQLKEFHGTHYHPSSGLFYTYGNIPLNEILTAIERDALDHFEHLDVDFTIPDQPNFDKPKEFHETYPLSKEEDSAKKAQVLLAWKTTNVADSFTAFALRVLSEVLLGNPASPLTKALISSGLGDDLSEMTGFFDLYREGAFAVGLKNVAQSDAEKIEGIILETLRQLVAEGVDQDQVDAAIHQLEIEKREVSNLAFPYALKVFFNLIGAATYGGDAYRALQFDQDLELLRREQEGGRFFEDLIQRYLLDNPHRVRFILAPDQDLEETQKESELQRLAGIEEKLSTDEKQVIVDETRKLKELQEAKQDLSSLPTLELSDVPMEFEDVPHSIEDIRGARVGFFPQPTNGLTYIDIRMDHSVLPDKLKDRLALFAHAVPKMGAGDDDYLKMAGRINSYTGGVSMAAGVRSLAQNPQDFRSPVVLAGKALARNHGPFVEILKDLLGGVYFEPTRLREVLAELTAQMESSVLPLGFAYAISLAASKLSATTFMEERLSGLTQLAGLKQLAGKEEQIIGDLESIRGTLFRNAGLQICVTSEEKHFDEIRGLLDGALSALEPGSHATSPAPPAPEVSFEARTISVPVSHNAKVFAVPGYSSPDAPPLQVLGNYLQHNYIHREIREKGGAYGGYANLDREKGLFSFASYRDPNIVRTFQVFDSAIPDVLKEEIEPEKLQESILRSAGEVDPLLSPDTKGRRRFYNDLAGYTLELQEKFKKGLLEVTEEDLRRVAETYLMGDNAVLATIGGAAQVEEANREMGDIFKVSPV